MIYMRNITIRTAKSESYLGNAGLREVENSHNKAILKAEGGFVGAVFGSRTEKPGNVALIVILLCFLLIFWVFIKIDISINSELFFKLLSIVFGIVTLALGYLFGSSNRQ